MSDNDVTIKSSGNRYSSEKLIGYTVGQVRNLYGSNFDISREAIANVAGVGEVDDDHVLQPGEKVTFAKPTGTKG